MYIARGSFRDYSTMEELLKIPPPLQTKMYELHWDPQVLDKPLYDCQEGEIEKANLFSMRLSALCRHYAIIDGDKEAFYRRAIHNFNITAFNGKERWTAYNFSRRVYDKFGPLHLAGKKALLRLIQIP